MRLFLVKILKCICHFSWIKVFLNLDDDNTNAECRLTMKYNKHILKRPISTMYCILVSTWSTKLILLYGNQETHTYMN